MEVYDGRGVKSDKGGVTDEGLGGKNNGVDKTDDERM